MTCPPDREFVIASARERWWQRAVGVIRPSRWFVRLRIQVAYRGAACGLCGRRWNEDDWAETCVACLRSCCVDCLPDGDGAECIDCTRPVET